MGLKKDFDQAAKDALTLPPSTTNDDKLVLYGLFKSATVGKSETSRPGIFDPKGRVKWDAWKMVEDKSKDEGMQDYILKHSRSSWLLPTGPLVQCHLETQSYKHMQQ